MSNSFKLFRLQQIDSQLDQVRARLSSIESTLNDDTVLREVKNKVAEKENQLNDTRKSLHRIEDEVRTLSEKIAQTDTELYGGKIQNPKELQDIQKESISLKKQLSNLEDKQIEWMIKLEDDEAEYKQSTLLLQDTLSKVSTQNSVLLGEQRSILSDYERIKKEREVIASTIERVDLDLYELLRQQRKGVAVSAIVDQSCSGCGSSLTPAMVQAAHNPGQIIRCGFCGRILYSG